MHLTPRAALDVPLHWFNARLGPAVVEGPDGAVVAEVRERLRGRGC